MNKLYLAIGFIVGAAAGSIVTAKLVEKKYKDISDAEIESVKKAFSEERTIFAEEKETEIKASVAKEKPDILKYASVLNKEGYTDKAKSTRKHFIRDDRDYIPYVIKEDEFVEDEKYEKISLKYYKTEAVVTDDDDEKIDDPADVVPVEGLDRYFEDDDVVYVRNDRLKCDYEILMVLDSYEDILAEKPYLNRAADD